MDPISALAAADAALATIKKAVNTGKEFHEVVVQIGEFFGAVTAAKTPKEKPVFKKLLDKGSVEQEALERIVNQKKLEQMESDLRELIVYTYGTETYKEMIVLRRQIKIDRDLEITRQKLLKKQIVETYVFISSIIACILVIVWMVLVILNNING